MRLIICLVCLTLCASVTSSRADLQFQSSMDQWCKPARATGYSILRWQPPPACQNDCFTWRLTCTSGKHVMLQSAISPATTQAQWSFKSWAPWSFIVYLAVIFGYATMAFIGSEILALQIALNGVLVSYAVYAAWAWCAAVTGNPWAATAEFDRLFVFNSYIYAAVMAGFFILNFPAVRRVFEDCFVRHDVAVMPVISPNHVAHAEAMRAALMPHMFEFINPHETVEQYRRETEKVLAVREKLDAYTALLRAVIQRERMRLNPHD